MAVRIVAVADTHLWHRDLKVPDGDVFVHAGDLCNAGTLAELGTALHWMDSLPHETKIVVAGNHDWAFARPEEREVARAALRDAGILYLEDEAATVAGLRVYGTPWQPEFCDWAFNLPRGAALADVWAKIPADLDLLITHGPPAGYGDRVGKRHEGCADLRERVAVVRPRVHVFGHIHEDGGVWRDDHTIFANVTTAMGSRQPTVIDFEPGTSARIVDAPAADAD